MILKMEIQLFQCFVHFIITGRALFNPHVDYNNQWLPVGHSDPLKNDPTFDYVPPAFGSVRYWPEDSAKNAKEKNLTGKATGKDEILLLGAPVEHSMNVQTNHLTQTEMKSPPASRRSSPYYPPEVRTHLYYSLFSKNANCFFCRFYSLRDISHRPHFNHTPHLIKMVFHRIIIIMHRRLITGAMNYLSFIQMMRIPKSRAVM